MDNVKKNNFEILFYIGYFLLIIIDMFINVPYISRFYSQIMKLGLLLVVIFDVLSCWYNEIDRKKILLLFIISVLLTFFYLFSGDLMIFKIFVLVVGLMFINFHSFIENDLKIKISLLLILFILSFTIMPSINTFDRTDGTMRFSLGVQHPNFLSTYVMIIVLEIYYLYYLKKFSLTFIFILLLSIMFEIFVPNTRTCVMMLIMLLGYYIVSNIKIRNFKIDFFQLFKKLLCYLPIILLLVSLILSTLIFYDIEIIDKINTLLADRIYLYGQYLDSVHIPIFGKNIFYLQKEFPLDNAYLYLLFKFGIIQFSIIMFFICKLFRRLINEKEYGLCVIIILLELYSFAESTPIIPTINVFILVISVELKNIFVRRNDKNNNMVNIKDVQRLQLNMLEKVTKYLDDNNINYYLCGGTLLGAIRHKGFIPWDDDIDIFVPRPDYEKLIDSSTDKYISDHIVIKTIRSSSYEFPFIKAYDTRYIVEEEKIKTKEEYLWIDIFPVDGMSDDQKENELLINKVVFYRKLLMAKMYKNNEFCKLFNGKVKIFIKTIEKFFISLIPAKVYSRKIDKISKNYSYDSSNYVGGIMWGYGPQERIDKKEFVKKIDVEFEGKKFTAFACWDEYLKNLYGDYMKLPPESEREFHLIRFERVEKNEKKNNN